MLEKLPFSLELIPTDNGAEFAYELPVHEDKERVDASVVPSETLPRAIEVLSAELRRRADRLVELPPGERVDYETVTGKPWQAFNDLSGGSLESRRGEPGPAAHDP